MKEIDKSNLVRNQLGNAKGSPFQIYRALTVGNESFTRFVLYELLLFFLGPLPGGIGFFLRKKLYPHLFKKAGKGLIIGRNVVLRHPWNIELGDNVTIDDNCLIDARGAGSEGVILEDDVMINRNCMVQSKAGPISLRKRVSIGSNSVIVSMDGVELEEAVLVAGGCYISGGAYHFADTEQPIMDQGCYTKGPILIKKNAWIGTNVTVLDGVKIGTGAVVGAGAVVVKDISDYAVAVGVPAKEIKSLKF